MPEDTGEARVFKRGPLPLSEQPPRALTMTAVYGDDGRVTSYVFTGDKAAMRVQEEVLTAALFRLIPAANEHHAIMQLRGRTQSIATLALQLAGLIADQGHPERSDAATTTLGHAWNVMFHERTRRQREHAERPGDRNPSETLAPGLAYFEFDWKKLLGF